MLNANLDFYYANQAEQFAFYRIPKQLFTDKRFHDLSAEAKILYGLLLDRMSLSLRNKWIDEENRVYIYFKVSEAMEYMNICKEKAVRLFAELECEKGYGLILRRRQGLGKPSIIYVMNFNSNTIDKAETPADFKSSEIPKSGSLDNTDFKRSEKPTSGGLDSTDFKRSEIQTSGGRKNRLQEFGKTDSNNTKINNTDFNDTESTLSDHDMDKIDRMVCTEKIKKNIGYEHLLEIYQKEDIDGLLNIIVDTVCSKKPYLIIAGEKTPKTIVAIRLLNLNSNHIEYVMDSLKKNATSIKNIKNYLLTALYNASSTIGHYYRAEANYDMNGGTI